MKIGLIDYFIDEWHANQYPVFLQEASGGEIQVAYAWAQQDSYEDKRPTGQWCRDMNITHCATQQEVIEKSDGLIVLSPDHCQYHEALSHLALASGKPVFVDKTFAPNVAAAQRMFERAEAYGTPLYSTSALRYAAEYQNLAPVEVLQLTGPGGLETYSVHQLEPLVLLMGGGARRLLAHKKGDWVHALVEFGDGRLATLTCTGRWDTPFAACIGQAEGQVLTEITSDFFQAFSKTLAHFFKTGTVPVPKEQTLAVIALREALLAGAEQPGTWIAL